jgi:hypothetical protein
VRTLIRALAVTAAIGALVLGGASAAFAGSPNDDDGGGVSSDRPGFDVEWCFDYGSTYECTVAHTALMVTVTPDGRASGRIAYRAVVTSFAADGAQIGQVQTISMDRTVFAEDGLPSTFSVSHTHDVGEFGTCVSTSLFKVENYELHRETIVGAGCR